MNKHRLYCCTLFLTLLFGTLPKSDWWSWSSDPTLSLLVYYRVLKVSSVTNSVRYVFAHCSQNVQLLVTPITPLSPFPLHLFPTTLKCDMWRGATDLFAYKSADVQKK